MFDLKEFCINQDTIRKNKIEKKLIFDAVPRDTSLRDKYLNFIKSELEKQLSSNDCQQIMSLISKHDIGHVVELQHGGTNEFSNLILESKFENREPGLKRHIERKNQDMLTAGKRVTVKNELNYDTRIPIPVPCKWKITQEICHKNGRQYQTRHFEMSSEPYLELATNSVCRSLFLKSDIKRGMKEVGINFAKASVIKASSLNEECVKKRIKNAILTGFKVSSSYIAKNAIKVGLDCAQTSNFFSQEIKNKIAKTNVNKSFNTILNNSAWIASDIILLYELKNK